MCDILRNVRLNIDDPEVERIVKRYMLKNNIQFIIQSTKENVRQD